jgi:DNA-binding HxlR family transcriptional regulator
VHTTKTALIRREVFALVPPPAEYSLMPMGKSLIKPREGLCHWAKNHVKERAAARASFDSRRPSTPTPLLPKQRGK